MIHFRSRPRDCMMYGQAVAVDKNKPCCDRGATARVCNVGFRLALFCSNDDNNDKKNNVYIFNAAYQRLT